MSRSKLYADVTGVTKPLSINVSTSHGSSTASATIECVEFTGSINDEITIDLGYIDYHQQVFKGYIKQIDQKVKPNVYTITAQDILIRAADYFMVSDNPETPYTWSDISAEDLVADVLDMAGLSGLIVPLPTNFTFGTKQDVEANLLSAYDFIKNIADILAWHLYADVNGDIYFLNRKPYPMLAGSIEQNQPGWTVDVPITTPLTVGLILDATFTRSERDLRNRVVVYGTGGIKAVAEEESCFLPTGFRKSAVFSGAELVDKQSIADDSAEYNLTLYHRLSKVGSLTVLGDPELIARKTVNLDALAINAEFTGEWYIFSAEHSWSNAGYTVGLDLRSFELCP